MFNVKIITPTGIKADLEAEYVEFKTVEGKMGVLTNRLPIVSKLAVSELKIKQPNNTEVIYAVLGGILDMNGKELVVLTTAAEKPDDINIESARKSLKLSEEKLKSAKNNSEKEKLKNEIEKNKLRVNISKK